MCKLLVFSALLFHFSMATAAVISCTHPEICRMADIIIKQDKNQVLTLSNIIILNGDPHEFEPSITDAKKLMEAKTLLVGPMELNPWMKKISFLRSNNSNLLTIKLNLPEFSQKIYPGKETEPFGHFWLYPQIYCQLKKDLAKELKLSFQNCEALEIEKKLKENLIKIKMPIILTHDALLPLLKALSINKNNIFAIKGSSHHEEASASSIKKIYDALKAPRVVWVLEDNITTPENIKSKIRKNDIILSIDTAKSPSDSSVDFALLENLNNKLIEINK